MHTYQVLKFSLKRQRKRQAHFQYTCYSFQKLALKKSFIGKVFVFFVFARFKSVTPSLGSIKARHATGGLGRCFASRLLSEILFAPWWPAEFVVFFGGCFKLTGWDGWGGQILNTLLGQNCWFFFWVGSCFRQKRMNQKFKLRISVQTEKKRNKVKL